MSFTPTPKQIEALALQSGNLYTLLYGGSRSGKTAISVGSVIARSLAVESRHLIVRFRFNHVKTSIWYDTFPKMFRLMFPDERIQYKENKSDWFVEMPNGSEIWFGGIDDKERTEKILGNEYSTILANEVSQLSYPAIEMLMTRLAENSGLDLKMFLDCNPPSKKHWTHKMFIDGVHPIDGTPLTTKRGSLQMNPADNQQNLASGYIENVLMNMSQRGQERFLLGNFLSDVEGALWSFQEVVDAKTRLFTHHVMNDEGIVVEVASVAVETVVAVDPAVTQNADSDLTGIVVASRLACGNATVDADYSCKASPLTWAQIAVNAYHTHMASCIVVEVNQGGDLVEAVIRQVDQTVRIVKVHASKGKFARAEPVLTLYEQKKVAHNDGLDELEDEMMEYVPISSKKSPDRLDAMVYALTHLMLQSQIEPIFRIM